MRGPGSCLPACAARLRRCAAASALYRQLAWLLAAAPLAVPEKMAISPLFRKNGESLLDANPGSGGTTRTSACATGAHTRITGMLRTHRVVAALNLTTSSAGTRPRSFTARSRIGPFRRQPLCQQIRMCSRTVVPQGPDRNSTRSHSSLAIRRPWPPSQWSESGWLPASGSVIHPSSLTSHTRA